MQIPKYSVLEQKMMTGSAVDVSEVIEIMRDNTKVNRLGAKPAQISVSKCFFRILLTSFEHMEIPL